MKYMLALVQLIFLYGLTTGAMYWGSFLVNGDGIVVKSEWWAILLRSFSLITLPTTILIFLGMTFPPLPVDPEKITDHTTPVVIRWTTRGTYPQLVNLVLHRTYEHLRQFAPHIRFEVVTEHHIVDWAHPDVPFQEMVIPQDYETPKRSAFKARALHYGATHSQSSAEAYILHLDEESIVTQNLYLGVRQFISERPGYIGQGVITYANVNRNWQSYVCHLADAMRTGDDHARFRFQCLLGFNLVGMKGSFMLIPNTIEHSVGFDHGPHSSITEDAWFAMINYDKVRFCNGVLEEQSPFTILDTIKQRKRWCSGLWQLLFHHPAQWWKKSILFLQMVAWVLSPLVAVSLISSLVLYEYEMPRPLSLLLTFNFVMFNVQYLWGCYHLIHATWYGKLFALLITPIALPLFLFLEGAGGLAGTFCPAHNFELVQKETTEMHEIQTSQ